MDVILLTASLALLIGAVLGLLGGGGGILAVPLLVYVAGVGAKPAIATSLFFVGATSALGAALAAREGRVRWTLGALFGAGAMAGAFAGGALAQRLPETLLLGGLATVMLVTALAMLRGRSERARGARPIAKLRIAGVGAVVGVISGLVGAGGGFLIVPALTLLGGLALREAIGTSLFVIALQSFAGFAGHLGHVELPVTLLAIMTAAALVGMIGGRLLARHLPTAWLLSGFAGLVLATGLFVLGRLLPPLGTALVALVTLSLAFLARRRRPQSRVVSSSE